MWAHGLLYIEGGFGHLYHPRIFHLCNVLEFPPRSGSFLRRLYLFSSLFGAGYTTFGIRGLDSSVSLLEVGHYGIFAINFFIAQIQ